MIETHFQYKDIVLLLLGLVFVFSSILFFLKERIKLSLLFLTTGGLILRFFMIHMDPFIYTWDEQFHALVAKNMMTQPFKPMLYANPVLPYNISEWASNHIWLHKGPVFLWLIALSFKMFGVNEITLRIPSLLMSTGMLLILFRMGKILINKQTGYLAAFLFATANCQLEMVSGMLGSDHNDVAFMFFVCLSFWAWLEYKNSGGKGWLILIGIFSGLAVDTKWVMGFLIFFCWLLTILFNKEKRKHFISYSPLVKSMLIALVTCLPWYIYAYIRFPDEMSVTLKSYSDHFSSVLEGHSGGIGYHFALLSEHYGWIISFIILPCLYFFYKGLATKKDFKIALIAWVLSVELFYAIASTKMPLFTIIIAPVIYLSIGFVLARIIAYPAIRNIKFKLILLFLFIAFIGFANIHINEIEGHHTDTGLMIGQREKHIHNSAAFKDIALKLPQKDYVIFNCKDAIQAMFYTGMTAYPDVPDSATCADLEKKGIKLAVVNDGKLPGYILNDVQIVKLNYTIITDSDRN